LIIGFYYVFLQSGLPEINHELLYSFVPSPEHINTMFLGIIDLTSKSATLAAIAGIAQYFQAKLLIPKETKQPSGNEKPMVEDIMKGVQGQMVYVMPIVLVFIAYSFGAIVALYLVTSTIFALLQEIYMRKKVKPQAEANRKVTTR
ncbi:MAG: YidC/Oxa1 family membrane protein insertase, partial [bacterium]|nr:YidC/Oxa1 family membrane protein insertase [bacterium]